MKKPKHCWRRLEKELTKQRDDWDFRWWLSRHNLAAAIYTTKRTAYSQYVELVDEQTGLPFPSLYNALKNKYRSRWRNLGGDKELEKELVGEIRIYIAGLDRDEPRFE